MGPANPYPQPKKCGVTMNNREISMDTEEDVVLAL